MQIDKETLTMLVALAAVVGSIVSSVVGALAALVTTWLIRRSEERKHFREIVINISYKYWGRLASNIEKRPGGGQLYPLEDFILLMSKSADLIFDKKLTAKNIEASLEEIGAMNMKMREYRDKEYERLNAPASTALSSDRKPNR